MPDRLRPRNLLGSTIQRDALAGIDAGLIAFHHLRGVAIPAVAIALRLHPPAVVRVGTGEHLDNAGVPAQVQDLVVLLLAAAGYALKLR